MADRKHKCLPLCPFFPLPLHTALLHKLGHRHSPTICQRSLAFGFTFHHYGDPRRSVHIFAQPHHVHRLTHTQTHTHQEGGFSEPPEKWSWLLSTISLNGERRGQPRRQTLWSCLFGRIELFKVKFAANGRNTFAAFWADELPSNWLTLAKEQNHVRI